MSRLTKSRIRRDFRAGNIDNQEAFVALHYIGVSETEARTLTDQWTDEMDEEERIAMGDADSLADLEKKLG